MISMMGMDLEKAIEGYRVCPYTQLAMPGVCDDCQLNQGFIVEDPGGKGGQLHTTVCRLIDVLDDTLAMMREEK
jgi:hypothetical protein